MPPETRTGGTCGTRYDGFSLTPFPVSKYVLRSLFSEMAWGTAVRKFSGPLFPSAVELSADGVTLHATRVRGRRQHAGFRVAGHRAQPAFRPGFADRHAVAAVLERGDDGIADP